jgi:isoleucyl-tRNA synthetase
MSAPFSFPKPPTALDFPKEEAETLAFWKSSRIIEKSLASGNSGDDTFVFYEGPPTANGMPHNGHVLTRVVKDLFPRYQAMRGKHVPRKAGWDTHGLPVEVEVEKELRIHGKAAIEEYGVEPFVRRCIDSVFRYTEEWERLTERIGFWVDLESAYVTYHQSYVESVWWALAELYKKGLLYQGHKVVWWWAQGGTALSSGEVGQGYKTVKDPSAYVAFPIVGDASRGHLLVWTTTPWTLPSNVYAAVAAKHDYVRVRMADGRELVMAAALREALAAKVGEELPVVATMKGADLVGVRYAPPFDYVARVHGEVRGRLANGEEAPAFHRVVAADFVTLDTGTGIVHVAPAFGQDDFETHRAELKGFANGHDLPLPCAVKSDGTFVPELEPYAGKWVKSCDDAILADLKGRGLLVHGEKYEHDYPYCWRADDDPLIQFARPCWYIATTKGIDRTIANNQTVRWLPDHIKEGRFGDFLRNNVDWALSRERYWGTPLNVWINDETGAIEVPESVAAILAKNPHAFDHFEEAKKADPKLNENLRVHKPWIDKVTWQNPGEPGTYRRVPDVIDCWFDSGCMPFAQHGFPHQGQEAFRRAFPADFISEAIDQTRGWFYSLITVGTLVFDAETQARYGLNPVRQTPYPYKTCIVLGHVCDKEGKKESKSKGNYTPPDVILDRVRMEFAVLDPSVTGVQVESQTAYIAREDLDGLDLEDGAKVRLYRAATPGKFLDVTLKAHKKLRRRVVALSPVDAAKLGLRPTGKVDVKPVEVPSLPDDERVYVEDASTPAPGADAFRWFFYAGSPPWTNTRHSLSNVRAQQKDFLVKIRNVHSFFTIYANIDGFVPRLTERGEVERVDVSKFPANAGGELDRWILSELDATTEAVLRQLDGYEVHGATQKLLAFVDALSNWYVRRGRERYWKSGFDDDKRNAFHVLYECLVQLTKLMAPFVPFMAERMWQSLVVTPARHFVLEAPESVHLARIEPLTSSRYDAALSARIEGIRDLVSTGLQVRTAHKLKVRQPLRTAHVVVANDAGIAELQRGEAMIKDELNVLEVKFHAVADGARFVTSSLKPNFRSLGQRGLGKEAQVLKKRLGELAAADAFALYERLAGGQSVSFEGVELRPEDVEVALVAKDGFAAARGSVGVVVLETTLDDELRSLGFLRELQARVQTARKEAGFDFADRIVLELELAASDRAIVEAHAEGLAREVLAVEVRFGAAGLPSVEVEGRPVGLRVERVAP